MDQQVVVVDNGPVSSCCCDEEEEGKGGEAGAATTTTSKSSSSAPPASTNSTRRTPTNLLLQRHYSTIGIGDVFAVLMGDGGEDNDGCCGSTTTASTPAPPLPSCYLNLESNIINNNNKMSSFFDGDDDNNNSSSPSSSSFISWEIVGTIKSVPEDFIVREIGLFDAGDQGGGVGDDGKDDGNNKKNIASTTNTTITTTSKILKRKPRFNIPGLSTQQITDMRVADINVDATTTTTTEQQQQPINNNSTDTSNSNSINSNINNNESDLMQQKEDSGKQRQIRQEESKRSPSRPPSSPPPQQQKQLSPIEVLKIELQHARTKTTNEEVQPVDSVNNIIKSLGKLNERAKELLSTKKNEAGVGQESSSSKPNGEEKNDEVCFSTTSGEEGNMDDTATTTTTTTTFNRGAFHWAMRLIYPLLQANSVVVDDEEEGNNKADDIPPPNVKTAKTITFHVRVTIEDIFSDLIPSLLEPQVDIEALYLFLKSGIGNANNSNRSGKQNTILKLRPDLPRSERRPIHQMIENKTNSSLATRTLPEYDYSSLESATNKSSITIKTAAIVVYWSKTAGRRANKKKRKRAQQQLLQHEELHAPGWAQHDQYPHVLFVLKKTQIEHLNAMQILTTALNCRQADVGLAGIKDMHAITYQFCTLSNIPLSRLLRAQETLNRRRIEIGNVHKVNWTLRKGDLDGNCFEIVIRDTRRLRVTKCKNDTIREDFATCDIDHLKGMVNRLKKNGFINFYGEQRMGAPGLESIVGVRAFDIGKAMLQRKYSKAIDLLMTGRLICRGSSEMENVEIRTMRNKWKETNGDPFETWKCIPRSASVPREKLVLKGLKRYGRDSPLSALRCLQYNERVFFISCYQSYLWNVMATERIQRYGIHEVIPGDLVLGKDEAVVIVDKASCGHYKTNQIVLPMPGYDTLYPANEIGDLCKEKLRLDGVSFEKDAPLESTAKGSYRHLLAKATNILFEAIRGSDGELHSKLKFDLPRGSYATMVLREIMLTTVVRE